jgi:hypothetical protein
MLDRENRSGSSGLPESGALMPPGSLSAERLSRAKRLLKAVMAAGLLGAGVAPSIRLVDVAREAGLKDTFYCGSDTLKKYIIETLGNGVAVIDYNNDGYPDLFFVTGSRLEGFPKNQEPSNQLYRNNRDGTFTKVTGEAGLTQSGWGQGVCAGDFDNDGFEDLFVTYYGQNHLYRNTGKGSFVDVTEAAGLKQDQRWSTGCAFVDYDLDGKLDLFVANYVVFQKDEVPLPGGAPDCKWHGLPVLCGPRGLPGGTNLLFHNEGNGRFRNVSVGSGITKPGARYSLSVTSLDFDRDGWPDIYVAVDSQPSLLFHNRHDGTFSEFAVESGVAYSEDGKEQAGMGSAAGDFDGDGWFDIVKTNFIDDAANLYRNTGKGTFEDLVHVAGMGKNTQYMGWGVVFFDYDNDSWPDIFMVNGQVYPELEKLLPGSLYREKRLLYRNLGGKNMADVSANAGPGVTEPHSSRGLAFVDFDNDGDLDLVINNMNEPPSLLRNDGGNRLPFLSLKLVGVRSNRSAIGAVVTLTAGGRTQVQQVVSGSSFLSQNDLRLHFGLGEAQVVDRIVIRWPFPNSVDSITKVKPNQFLTITEGKGVTDARKFSAP